MSRQVVAFGSLFLGMMFGIGATSASIYLAPVLSQPSGVTRETLIESQVFAPPPSPSTMSSFRLTYEPSATFDASFPGPVALHVVSGAMAIDPDRKTSVGYHFARDDDGLANGRKNDPKLESNELGETVLTAGWSVTIEDGQLGATRNASTEPLVVNAVLLFPQPLYTGAARHETVKSDSSEKRDREERRKQREARTIATPLAAKP